MLIKLELPDDTEVVSTNDMYTPIPRKGGRGAYVTKSYPLRVFQDKMKEFLDGAITDEEIDELNQELEDRNVVLSLSIKYSFLRDSFFTEDSSNYIKSLEDCISQRLKVDDSRNCRVYVEKELSESSKIKVEISTYKLPYEIPGDRKWKALRSR